MSPFSASIEAALLTLLGTPAATRWADSVLRLSNHYVANPDAKSPWAEDWAKQALLSYYHPLNQARAERITRKGIELGFFEGLEHIVDIGCGSAAASLGLLKAHTETPTESHALKSLILTDHSEHVLETARKIATLSGFAPGDVTTSRVALTELRASTLSPSIELTKTVFVLSYVLTETNAAKTLERLLANNPTLEALFILEPSTSQDGRKLQALREILLQHGFDLWAPCPHTGDCPLLKDSDKDWCHDRLVPALPSWWSEMEAHLPMKNRTITVSYLLARKKKKNVSGPAMVRVIGDRLEEKTKIRQMICRGPSREFISWFPSRLSRLQIENSDFSVADFRLERGDLFQSHDTLWSDRRGHERSHEFRLDLQATQHIHETVVRHAHARKNVSETE